MSATAISPAPAARRSTKRTVRVASSSPPKHTVQPGQALRRFLVATDGFKAQAVLTAPVLPIHANQAVFSSDFGVQPLVIGHIEALSDIQAAERSDLCVSVKLFLPSSSEISSADLARSIREALQSVKSLLKTTFIDSLIVELPSSAETTTESPVSETATTSPAASAKAPARKTRRVVQNTTWETIERAATHADFGVRAVSVSSKSAAQLAAFVAALAPAQRARLASAVVDYPRDVCAVAAARACADVPRIAARVAVSNDGADGLPACSFATVVERLEAVAAADAAVAAAAARAAEHTAAAEASVRGAVVQDWVAKYSCFDTQRSVLCQHGYLMMGSLH